MERQGHAGGCGDAAQHWPRLLRGTRLASVGTARLEVPRIGHPHCLYGALSTLELAPGSSAVGDAGVLAILPHGLAVDAQAVSDLGGGQASSALTLRQARRETAAGNSSARPGDVVGRHRGRCRTARSAPAVLL